jgi:hypothetical protein
MKFFDNKMEDALQNGVKETNYWDESIDGNLNEFGCVDNVIENGVKKISPLDPEFSVRFIDGNRDNDWELVPNINEVIDNGVKETKTPGNGDLLSTFQWMEENNTKSVPKMIDDVIENGYKVSGTFVGGKRQKENIESVIDYGTKNPTD